jgi:hypothetical protein
MKRPMVPSTMNAARLALPAALALALVACATTAPPTAQMAVSEKSVHDAIAADAPRYAPIPLRSAQDKLDAARIAMNEADYDKAERLAEEAQADADLAATQARSVKAQHAAAEVQDSIRALRGELARNPQP